MKRYSVAFVSTLILLCGIWYTDSISAREISPSRSRICCVGQWDSKSACAVAYDEQRNLVFAGCSDCVCILDISNPDKPSKISDFVHMALTICGLCYDKSSGYLFLVEGDQGFEIWDVSDVTVPKKIGDYDTPGYTCGLAINDKSVYVADGDAGLRVIDISDPSAPTEIAALDMTCATNVTISDHCVYVTDLGLRVIDISDPEWPEEIAYLETPGVTRDVYVEGHYAYVADDWKGVRIIDISNKHKPREVGNIITSGYAWDLDLAGSNLYLAACGGGLRAIDISDPMKPHEMSVGTTAREALSVVVAGQHAYVAQVTSGLGIYSSEPTRGNTVRIESSINLAACR